MKKLLANRLKIILQREDYMTYRLKSAIRQPSANYLTLRISLNEKMGKLLTTTSTTSYAMWYSYRWPQMWTTEKTPQLEIKSEYMPVISVCGRPRQDWAWGQPRLQHETLLQKNKIVRASKMAQRGKAHTANPDNLSSIPKTQMVEKVLPPASCPLISTPVPWHAHI